MLLATGLASLMLVHGACGTGGTPPDRCAVDNGGCGDPRYVTCVDDPARATPECVDIDECALGSDDCEAFEVCRNDRATGWTCLACEEMALTTDSTRADWAPFEIINTGAPLTWEVSGGVTIAPVTTDEPVLDLSANTGEATIRVTSSDRFEGVTSFQFNDAGISSVTDVACLRNVTTFALRNNPITAIDVSGLRSIDNLTIRSCRLEAIDLSALSTLRLLWIYGNQLTALDCSHNPSLEYVKATDNLLPTTELEQLLIDLDGHGKPDGEVQIAHNPGGLTNDVSAAYQSLVAKGWVIDVALPDAPEQCEPGYRFDGAICVDENECLGEGSGNNCTADEVCSNTPGGFTCTTPCVGSACPLTVAEWRALFDERWPDFEDDCLSRSLSGGVNQEYYFLGYYIDGLIGIWRATGDDQYLDRTLGYIRNTLADAVLGADGYRHWEVEYPLWESYYWRHVATLLRVMNDNPALRARGNYQAEFDDLLEFTEVHIWNKWEADGLQNFYRSRTHMASHWARIGMELYRITGTAKYLEVFENISFGQMVGRPSNLRNQLEPHPDHPSAYTWSSIWGNSASDSVQDTSHGGAIVSFWQTAAEAGMYWTDADLTALTSTLLDVIWPEELDGSYHRNVDGTDGDVGTPYPTPYGRLHEWLVLGRFDARVQERIEHDYLDKNLTYFGPQAIGIAALNAKILADGAPAY